MTPVPTALTARAIRTPRAAAVAGIAFSLLFATSALLTEWAIPPDSEEAGSWVIDDAKRNAVRISVNLLPFAGIAFLWFIGVLRDRIGTGEDRFFATVFLGSGLLFVAMFFVSGAIAASLLSTAADTGSQAPIGNLWPFGRRSAASLATVYGLRMAAVFTLSTTTIVSRLRLVPRWLTLLGYATAGLLLFGPGALPGLELVFPAWVLVLSVRILVVAYRDGGERREAAAEAGGG